MYINKNFTKFTDFVTKNSINYKQEIQQLRKNILFDFEKILLIYVNIFLKSLLIKLLIMKLIILKSPL